MESKKRVTKLIRLCNERRKILEILQESTIIQNSLKTSKVANALFQSHTGMYVSSTF